MTGYTSVRVRFLYENEKAIKVTTIYGEPAFIPKCAINCYVENMNKRSDMVDYDVATCVARRKKLI